MYFPTEEDISKGNKGRKIMIEISSMSYSIKIVLKRKLGVSLQQTREVLVFLIYKNIFEMKTQKSNNLKDF